MQFDFKGAYRLSLDFPDLTALRGHPETLRVPYTSPREMVDYFSLFLPIHTMTHIDLPWYIDTTLDSVSLNLEPMTFRAVILDFSGKQQELHPYLATGSNVDYSAYLEIGSSSLKNPFWQLIQKLKITSDDVLSRIEELATDIDIAQTIILIRTDWARAFNRYGASFNNPALEGRAAYLCHPWMDMESVSALVSSGVRAIGHDLPSLENPLFYATGGDLHPVVEQARKIAATSDDRFEERTFHNFFLKVTRPTRRDTIERFYIKNLKLSHVTTHNKKDTFIPDSYSKSHLLGTLLIVPLPMLQDPYGVACEVFFRPD